jgi:hypothetical protein
MFMAVDHEYTKPPPAGLHRLRPIWRSSIAILFALTAPRQKGSALSIKPAQSLATNSWHFKRRELVRTIYVQLKSSFGYLSRKLQGKKIRVSLSLNERGGAMISFPRQRGSSQHNDQARDGSAP